MSGSEGDQRATSWADPLQKLGSAPFILLLERSQTLYLQGRDETPPMAPGGLAGLTNQS